MSWLWILVVFAMIVPAMRCGRRYGMRSGWGSAVGDETGRGPQNRERIEALEAELDLRIEEIRSLEARLNEVENRMDFTERLLAERSMAS